MYRHIIFFSLEIPSLLRFSSTIQVFLITYNRHTHGRTPLDELSARRRGQHNIETQVTNIHVLSGIRTRDPSNQAAADLRLRHIIN
jgi:hypothetical protein